MITIYSNLEDNIFSEVTLKKGFNRLPDKIVKELVFHNKTFKDFLKKGFIKIEEKRDINKAIVSAESPDFESMTQPELKSYVLKNNIKVPSFKKADMLSVLMKG